VGAFLQNNEPKGEEKWEVVKITEKILQNMVLTK
jgi:hypothetical protein